MSLKMNESNIDRIIRVIVGLLAFVVALTGMVSGVWAIVAYVVGVLMLGTGLVGFCPIYAMLKLGTKK
jgi:hypothetical protein